MEKKQQLYQDIWCALGEVKYSPMSMGLNDELLEAPLCGYPLFMTPNEMMYLFLNIQRRFDVRFQESDVVDYAFNSVRRIAEAIERRTTKA